LTTERIGIRQLKERTSDILRRVRRGESFEITYRGRTVARVVPTDEVAPAEQPDAYWKEWAELSREIAERWPKGVSAVDAIREDRRDL